MTKYITASHNLDLQKVYGIYAYIEDNQYTGEGDKWSKMKTEPCLLYTKKYI